jgi:hypothetical protein
MRKIILLLCVLPLVCAAQLPNGGMESFTLTANNDTVPADWNTESDWSTVIGQNTNAFAGNYSFAINTWYHYSPGMMLNGYPSDGFSNFLTNWILAGTPISYKPAQLHGYYMYTDTVWGDSAVVKVLLKKWNSAAGKIDSVAMGIKKLPAASSWTPFSVDITDMVPGINPDSIVVLFMTFDYLAGTQPVCNDPICRFLYIDELSLSGTLGMQQYDQYSFFEFLMSDNVLSVQNKSSEEAILEIYSVEGKVVRRGKIIQGGNKIPVSDIAGGVYFARIKGQNKSAFRFVKM